MFRAGGGFRQGSDHFLGAEGGHVCICVWVCCSKTWVYVDLRIYWFIFTDPPWIGPGGPGFACTWMKCLRLGGVANTSGQVLPINGKLLLWSSRWGRFGAVTALHITFSIKFLDRFIHVRKHNTHKHTNVNTLNCLSSLYIVAAVCLFSLSFSLFSGYLSTPLLSPPTRPLSSPVTLCKVGGLRVFSYLRSKLATLEFIFKCLKFFFFYKVTFHVRNQQNWKQMKHFRFINCFWLVMTCVFVSFHSGPADPL